MLTIEIYEIGGQGFEPEGLDEIIRRSRLEASDFIGHTPPVGHEDPCRLARLRTRKARPQKVDPRHIGQVKLGEDDLGLRGGKPLECLLSAGHYLHPAGRTEGLHQQLSHFRLRLDEQHPNGG